MAGRTRRSDPADDVAPLSGDELAKRVKESDSFDEEAALAAAELAEGDTEEKLAELHDLQTRRGYWHGSGAGNKRYETLRDELTSPLEDGPRYFVDDDGVKRVAVRQQQEPVDVDGDALEQEIGDDEALLDAVMPRKVDKTAFKHAVQDGRISSDVLVKVARIRRNKPFVRFLSASAE
jgi:hypothetical protein